MDCRLPGSSVHGILQARILEWVAMLSTRASSWPKDENPHLLGFLHWQMGSLTGPSGKPRCLYKQKKFRDRQLDRENGMWRWRCITQERGLDQSCPQALRGNPPHWHLDLRLLASEIGNNYISVYLKPLSMGNTCTPMADSCQCMAKTAAIL